MSAPEPSVAPARERELEDALRRIASLTGTWEQIAVAAHRIAVRATGDATSLGADRG